MKDRKPDQELAEALRDGAAATLVTFKAQSIRKEQPVASSSA
jgi:hypothetical protein